MSTLSRINFEPVSDILPVWRRDLPLADPTLADPTNAVCLVDGEWVTLNSAYKWIRASTIGTGGNLATLISFPVFHEKGRSDRMGTTSKLTTALMLGHYEFDTRIFDASVALGSGAAITTVLQGLKVATITFSSRNFTGLVGHGGSADTSPIVGYVTKLPASNGGKLRFIAGGRR